MKASPPSRQFKGFEFSPQGSLLDQFIDLQYEMGVAYERSHGYYKDFHEHDRMIIVAPRGSCIMDVRTKFPENSFRIDFTKILIVPKGLLHDDEGVSQIYDTLALLPSDSILNEVLNREGIEPSQISLFKNTIALLTRSDWFDRLLQEYFFERILNQQMSRQSLLFFEQQLLYEVYRVWNSSRPQTASSDTNSMPISPPKDNLTERVLRFIEGNLYADMNIDEIARHCGASPATLRRKFKTDIKKSPLDYIRERRLEESAKLLRKKDLSISEVAILVGYQNFGSFSEAFKRKFNLTPSEYRSSFV